MGRNAKNNNGLRSPPVRAMKESVTSVSPARVMAGKGSGERTKSRASSTRKL
jgi:hypothetical protein